MRYWGLIGLVVVVGLLTAPQTGRAQAPLSLSTQLSAPQAAVGEPFSVQLTALASNDAADLKSPRLRVPGGVEVQGPSISTQQRVSLSGGQLTRQTGITATWTLVAARPGRFTLGPASIQAGGTRVQDRSVTIEIVAASARPPRRRRPRGSWPFDPFDDFDPFDLWSNPFPRLRPFDSDQDEPSNALPPVPDEYQIDRALDDIAFLDARATPHNVVVGEQVTLRIIAYGKRGPFKEGYAAEPKRADFLTHAIVDNSYGERRYRVSIGDDVWHAVKVRELALFPLKAGTLSIGPMTMDFKGRMYSSRRDPEGVRRQSRSIPIQVSEPPLAGRPTGYQVGDVGQYQLQATVQPRRVPAGSAVSVIAKLNGTGNLPGALRMPEQNGVEWLEPTVSEQLEVLRGKVGGVRTFSYVVELQRPGKVDLGRLELPYWDPIAKRYASAQAKLGEVVVAPSLDEAPARPKPKTDMLTQLLTVRRTLGSAAREPFRLVQSPWYWAVLAFGPLGFAAAALGLRALRRARGIWNARRENRSKHPLRFLKSAQQKLKQGANHEALGELERAVFLAVERSTGLKARGVLRDDLVRQLGNRGVDTPLAAEVVALLEQCETTRFADITQDWASLLRRAERCIRDLCRPVRQRAGGLP